MTCLTKWTCIARLVGLGELFWFSRKHIYRIGAFCTLFLPFGESTFRHYLNEISNSCRKWLRGLTPFLISQWTKGDTSKKKTKKLRPLLASPPTNRPTRILSRIGYGPDIWSTLSLFFNYSSACVHWVTNCKPPSPLGFMVLLSNDFQHQQQSTINMVNKAMDKNLLSLIWKWWEGKEREKNYVYQCMTLSKDMFLSLTQKSNMNISISVSIGFLCIQTNRIKRDWASQEDKNA